MMENEKKRKSPTLSSKKSKTRSLSSKKKTDHIEKTSKNFNENNHDRYIFFRHKKSFVV